MLIMLLLLLKMKMTRRRMVVVVVVVVLKKSMRKLVFLSKAAEMLTAAPELGHPAHGTKMKRSGWWLTSIIIIITFATIVTIIIIIIIVIVIMMTTRITFQLGIEAGMVNKEIFELIAVWVQPWLLCNFHDHHDS